MSDNSSENNLTLHLEMLSDWHVGTGAGIPGSIDAMIARDVDDFPWMPAKTITGIWRDAMETLTLGLDNGDPNNKKWQKWVDVIFGGQPNQLKEDEVQSLAAHNKLTPRPSILSIKPARLNENLRGAILGTKDERFKQALIFIKPNTAIDPDSGTAKTDSLRFTEMGRIGTVLQAKLKLDFDLLKNDSSKRVEDVSDEQKELIEALLVASAALVERVGGNRRRGSGKCEMQLPDLMSKDLAVKTIRQYQNQPLSIPLLKSSIGSSEENQSHGDELSIESAPSHFSSAPLGAAEQSTNLEAAPDYGDAQSTPRNGWKKISYTLKLHTPVAIVTNTLGNVSETLDFIPGTYLLPYITRQLTEISKYVGAGEFQVSPATPEVQAPKTNDKGEAQNDQNGELVIEKTRGLPVPKVIFSHKLESGFDKEVDGGFDKKQPVKKPTVYNRLREVAKVQDLTYQKKNYRAGYVSSLKEVKDESGNRLLPIYETTQQVLLMHNTVKDDIQRPHEDVGGVFSRQAIGAGQIFRGEIRLKESIAAQLSKQDEKWFEKLNGYVRLGTSKKDDYGLAEITVGAVEPDTSKPPVSSDELVIYLESDVLLRNDNLRQTNLVDDLKAELEKTLGQGTLKSFDEIIREARTKLENNENDAKAQAALDNARGKESLIQVRRVESWHEGWGFPRPTLTAMAAGSVVVFKFIGSSGSVNLQNPEISGIGERRGEGYGRIRFNPPLLTSKINEWTVQTKGKPESKGSREAAVKLKAEIKSAKELEEFVSIIELAAWRDELARAVLKIANDDQRREKIFGFEIIQKNGKKDSIPSLSQIGGLRSAISRLAEPNDKNVIGWLDHLEATANRLEKWAKNNDKEKAKAKLKEIKTLISNKAKVWDSLAETDPAGRRYFSPLPELLAEHKAIQDKLWADAVRSLFDACARAHKRDVEREEKKEGKANG